MNPQDAALAANALRTARAKVRADLAAGTIDIAHLVPDPPACMADVMLIDAIRWQRWMGNKRLRDLNREAIHHGVNLCVPLRHTTPRTAAFITRWAHKRRIASTGDARNNSTWKAAA